MKFFLTPSFFIFRMAFECILLGNSMVRGLSPPGFTQTICLPGAGWREITDHVVNNRNKFKQSVIWVLIGPLRFTHLEIEKGRREVTFEEKPEESIEEIFKEWKPLEDNHTYLVVCTLIPMSFSIHNKHLSGKNEDSWSKYENKYVHWDRRIKGHIVIENQKVVEWNSQNKMCTPFVHKSVFRRRNHHYAFRAGMTKDGLHPNQALKEDISHELHRNLVHNLIRMIDGEKE